MTDPRKLTMAIVPPRPTRMPIPPGIPVNANILQASVINTSSVSAAIGSIQTNWSRTEVLKPWQRWWAWRPVTTVSGERVWLRWCHRRQIRKFQLVGYSNLVQYGNLFDVMTLTE